MLVCVCVCVCVRVRTNTHCTYRPTYLIHNTSLSNVNLTEMETKIVLCLEVC